MRYSFTAKRRVALKKAQRVSARRRKGMKRSDTLGYWIRKVPSMVANGATAGMAGKASNLLERSDQKHSRKYKQYKVR
jgi:hypothetical protein